MSDKKEPLLSRRQAAAWLGVSVDTLARLIADGGLKAVKVGGHWRIRTEAVEALLAQNEDKGGAK